MAGLATAKSKILIKKATQEHIDSLKGNLRQGDLDEISACSARDPNLVLQDSFDRSVMAWAAVNQEGKCFVIWGLCTYSLLSDVGVPWLLGSKELASVGLEIGRCSRHYIHEMNMRYSFLENWIDARQKRSIKWLKWLGFNIEPAEPFGIKGMPFHKFWR